MMHQKTDSGPVEREATGSLSAGTMRCAQWELAVLIVLAVYAAGLMQEVHRPWVGLHDWNGAFFSQLARNVNRYPFELHHGMGWIALGEQTPSVEERSPYANHPPALVWLIAMAFRMGGESEAIARIVPIVASMISLYLFVQLMRRIQGEHAALLAALIYAVMPMSVYFGRMVNHEPICLMLMLAAIAAWNHSQISWSAFRRTVILAIWGVCMVLLVWTDWVGVVFAGVFCGQIGWRARANAALKYQFLFVCLFCVVSIIGMMAYLTYAGMGGRWESLLSVFTARSTLKPDVHDYWPRHVVENLTWPVIVVAGLGLISFVWGPRTKDEKANSSVGPGLIGVTGLIWLAIFWNLFARHSYWMFYLGPSIAMLSADGLLRVKKWISTMIGEAAAFRGLLVITALMCLFGLSGIGTYYSKISMSPGTIEAWQEINEQTGKFDRVALYENPVHTERWNGWTQRNIVPPQLTFYMDRAFDVVSDPAVILSGQFKDTVYLIPQSAVGSAPEKFRGLEIYPAKSVGGHVLLDLRRTKHP